MDATRWFDALRAAVVALFAGLMSAAVGAQTLAPPASGFIVQLRSAGDAAAEPQQRIQSVAAAQRAPLAVGRDLGGRWYTVVPTAELDATARRALLAGLRTDPRVERVVPDVREQPLNVVPSDAFFPQQWWLQPWGAGNTGVAGFGSAWRRSTGAASGAAVAVLDSGITSHIETNARVLPGWDFVADAVYSGDGNGRDNDPSDPGDVITAAERSANPAAFSGCPAVTRSSWHGTTVAGQLAAVTDNREGVAAAHWQALVLPVRVAGKCGAAVSDIVDGLRWAAGLPVVGVPANPKPVRLIVLSYGSIDACDAQSGDPEVRDTAVLYQQVLAELRAAGALVIVAAGNQQRALGRPGGCPGAFAVGSVNREGFKSSYSNFGAGLALMAPGGDAAIGATCDADLADTGVVSTGNLGVEGPGQAGYVAASGTSFAAPQVAAVAALMQGLNPLLTVDQLDSGLRATARAHVQAPMLGDCALGVNVGRCTCTTTTCGAGLLDADQALAYAISPALWQAPVSCTPTLLVDDRHVRCAVAMGRVEPSPLPVAQLASCAAPAASTPGTGAVADPGGGAGAAGGGALGPGWLLLLACAVRALCALERGRTAHRPHRRHGSAAARPCLDVQLGADLSRA